MKFTIPHQLRVSLYILTALGTPVIGYLFARDILGDLEVALWGAEVAVVSSMAALNVTPDTK